MIIKVHTNTKTTEMEATPENIAATLGYNPQGPVVAQILDWLNQGHTVELTKQDDGQIITFSPKDRGSTTQIVKM